MKLQSVVVTITRAHLKSHTHGLSSLQSSTLISQFSTCLITSCSTSVTAVVVQRKERAISEMVK